MNSGIGHSCVPAIGILFMCLVGCLAGCAARASGFELQYFGKRMHGPVASVVAAAQRWRHHGCSAFVYWVNMANVASALLFPAQRSHATPRLVIARSNDL
jgi:hypothetical protein